MGITFSVNNRYSFCLIIYAHGYVFLNFHISGYAISNANLKGRRETADDFDRIPVEAKDRYRKLVIEFISGAYPNRCEPIA